MIKNHLRVLGLALALAVAVLASVPPSVHASVYASAYSCARDSYDDIWVYYSDSTYTTVVGRCENDCGLYCHCSGTQTPYYIVITSRNC
jgi:hypothetical protein